MIKKLISYVSFFVALYCLAVTYKFIDYFIQNETPFWHLFPLIIYLLEIVTISILGIFASIQGWSHILWALSGILGFLSIVWMWSFGLCLIPAVLFYIFAAAVSSKGKSFKINFIYFFSAIIAEAGLYMIFNLIY